MSFRSHEAPVPNFQCPKCGKMSVVKYGLWEKKGLFGKTYHYHLECLACGWTRKLG